MESVGKNIHREETKVRRNPELLGKTAYEASIAIVPRYHDGTSRKRWEELGDIERWSWERPIG